MPLQEFDFRPKAPSSQEKTSDADSALSPRQGGGDSTRVLIVLLPPCRRVREKARAKRLSLCPEFKRPRHQISTQGLFNREAPLLQAGVLKRTLNLDVSVVVRVDA